MIDKENKTDNYPHSPFSDDLYQRLGVDRKADAAAIKRAYLKLAQIYHPDKPTAHHEKFLKIQEAYEALSDTAKRAQYDKYRKVNSNQQHSGYGASGQSSDSGWGSMFSGFSDFFETFMGGQARSAERQRRQNIETQTLLLWHMVEMATSLTGIIAAFDQWLASSGNAAIKNQDFFPHSYNSISIESMYKMLLDIQKNPRNVEYLQPILDEIIKSTGNSTAIHINRYIPKPNSPWNVHQNKEAADQTRRPEPKPKTEANITKEVVKERQEKLLLDLSRAKTLAETAEALRKWFIDPINTNIQTLHLSGVVEGNNFSPKDLSAEIQKFIDGAHTTLNQSEFFKSNASVIRGVRQQVEVFLQAKVKKPVADKPTSTAKPEVKVEEKTKPTPESSKKVEVVKVVDPDEEGPADIKKLREALKNTKNLQEALEALQRNVTGRENVINFPPFTRNVLILMLNAAVQKKDIENNRFFKKASEAKQKNKISPIAKQLLEFAQAGKFEKS